MALEVGRLVARIDIEGSFEQKLTAAKTAMEDAAKSAGRFDDAMSKAGQSGAKLKVSDEPKRKIDDAAKSATKLDDGLSKASESGKRLDVSNDARRKLDDTATSAGKTATSLDKASASGKNMQVSDQPRQKLAETASVADQVNTKFSGLGVTMKQVVGMAGGAAGLGAVLTKGWDRVTAIDTAQGKLRGLGHEAEGVSTIMASALDSVTGTAYGLGDAATIAANATAAGIAPGKELTKYLTMTADASAIAGVSLGEMGRILNQVQTGQAAYAGDLSQLADRGIPIYQWLADEAGVAADEIKGMASKGQISSEMLFSAIQTNIGGAAQEMGGTLVGSIANVGAAFGRLGAAAIDPFKDDIMGAAEGAQEFAGILASVVGPAASVAADGLGLVADVVGIIPTPILAATAGLVALQKTGLGASMAGAASTAVGALKGVGETVALNAMYAGDNVRANGLFAASMDGVRGAAGSLRTGLGNVVNMLGGPWMIGLAGATIAVTDIVGSIKRASSAQDAISESASRAATAHHDLASAIMAANGAMSDNATAIAQSIIEEQITATSAAAEQAGGMLAGLGNWIDQTTIGYDGMKSAIDGNVSAMDRSRLQGRVNEMQLDALKEAAGGLGISMDDVSRVVQEGGPRWELLRGAIAAIGPEGVDMANKLDGAKGSVDAVIGAATEAEVASMALAEAFRVMADESATAEDKTNALKAALDTLAGKQMTVDEAMFNYYETMDKVSDATTKMAEATGQAALRLEDGSLAFDHTSERSNMLRESFLSMKDATLQVAGTGEDMAPIWASNQAEMEKLAAATGFTTDELWALAEATTGFSQKKIEATVALHNGGAVLAELGIISQALADAEKGATIRVENIGDDALNYLKEVGWEAERIEGTTDITVVAKTEEARAELQGVIEESAKVGLASPNVDVSTNAKLVADDIMGIVGASDLVDQSASPSADVDSNAGDVGNALMGLLPAMDQVDQKTATPIINADTAAANSRIGEIFRELSELDMERPEPEVDLLIDQFMQGRDISHSELDALHARVVDPQARLLIEQLLSESARANADLDNTARPRTATITPELAAGSLTGIQSALNSMSFTVPVTGTLDHFSRADGGIDGVSSFADGGMLPSRAVIERPRGVSGMVQWAEAETGGEAFIPLAPSKRKRSRKIWAKTGELLGVNLGNLGEIASFADGGMLPDGDGKRGDMGGVLVPLFGKFADGGITASGLVNFAKGVEGAPYVWGGVNWGDCCLVGETGVWGPNGIKPISELKAGDYVYSYEDGKLTSNRVNAQWFSKRQETFKVRTRRRSVVGSDNHPFLRLAISEPGRPVGGVGNKGKHTAAKYDVEWARLDELAPGDLLVQPKDVTLDKVSNTLPSGREIGLNEAWLLGLILGDGSVQDTRIELCVFGDLRDRAQSVVDGLQIPASATRAARTGAGTAHSDAHGIRIHSTGFARELEEAGFRKPAHEKRIPDCVWGWDEDRQRAFLNGYCDADGHHPKNVMRHGERTVSSCSRTLIEDVRFLHIVLGDPVTNVTTNRRRKPITINGVNVKNARPLYTFGVSAKHDSGGGIAANLARQGIVDWIESGDFTLARVIDITPQGVQDTYDIEVNGAHNFIANGVVVHNSGAVSAIANYVSGRSPFGSRFATGNEGAALAERGFKTGRGSKGDLQIGWFNGGPYGGHTSATLPNGVNFEMGGGRGNGQYGGSAAGANSGQHTNHAHWPAEKFADAGETLGGAAVDNRTPRQKNIDAIVQEGQRRNLSDRDIQIALMTAEQESGIRVLNNPADPASMNMAAEGTGYDGTSTGIFQQQNNGAWGTLEERMDPTKSAGMFYDQLEKIEGRDSMALTQVAQAVQGSAHPDAYAKWEGKASEELAASKARLESLSRSGGGSGEGQKVFVTNWPSGSGSYTRSSSASSDAIDDAKDAVEDAQKAAFIQDQSIAAMLARSAGRADLIQVEKFADGGFHGLENHSAHIAPAGSWRVFGEPETGGEAYIPLASHKRARSTAILAETARRMGYSLGAGVNLVGSVLTGNGLDTGWGGPSLSDLGIDTGALRDSLSPGVQAEASRAGQQIAAILQELGQTVDAQVEGTLRQANDGANHLRQQYARAMI